MREDELPPERRLDRHAFRLDALDEWRDTVDARLQRLDESVRNMVNAQEVADAVAARLGARKRLELTLWQKLIGAVVVTATLYANLHGAGLL